MLSRVEMKQAECCVLIADTRRTRKTDGFFVFGVLLSGENLNLAVVFCCECWPYWQRRQISVNTKTRKISSTNKNRCVKNYESRLALFSKTSNYTRHTFYGLCRSGLHEKERM